MCTKILCTHACRTAVPTAKLLCPELHVRHAGYVVYHGQLRCAAVHPVRKTVSHASFKQLGRNFSSLWAYLAPSCRTIAAARSARPARCGWLQGGEASIHKGGPGSRPTPLRLFRFCVASDSPKLRSGHARVCKGSRSKLQPTLRPRCVHMCSYPCS